MGADVLIDLGDWERKGEEASLGDFPVPASLVDCARNRRVGRSACLKGRDRFDIPRYLVE
jgi:hypothetical protein